MTGVCLEVEGSVDVGVGEVVIEVIVNAGTAESDEVRCKAGAHIEVEAHAAEVSVEEVGLEDEFAVEAVTG